MRKVEDLEHATQVGATKHVKEVAFVDALDLVGAEMELRKASAIGVEFENLGALVEGKVIELLVAEIDALHGGHQSGTPTRAMIVFFKVGEEVTKAGSQHVFWRIHQRIVVILEKSQRKAAQGVRKAFEAVVGDIQLLQRSQGADDFRKLGEAIVR